MEFVIDCLSEKECRKRTRTRAMDTNRGLLDYVDPYKTTSLQRDMTIYK